MKFDAEEQSGGETMLIKKGTYTVERSTLYCSSKAAAIVTVVSPR